MPQVDLRKIFLASPSDVAQERKYVEQVVQEINSTVALNQGLRLEVVSSKNTYPGYGSDGQAILNQQIGNMEEYDLVVFIMWNRIGTKTPRAESGTVEEFKRAVTARKKKSQLKIWLYFRNAAANLNTEEDLEQKKEVLAFKKKARRKALIRDYKQPVNFRDRFRQDLLKWLSEPVNGKTTSTRSKKSSTTTGSATKSTYTKNKNTAVTETKKSETKTNNRSKSNVTSQTKKPSSSKSSSKKGSIQIQSVTTSGQWLLLDDHYYLAKSVSTDLDGRIKIEIATDNLEEQANLKDLKSDSDHYQRPREINYAHLQEASMAEVKSVEFESGGTRKNIFTIIIQTKKNSQNDKERNITYGNVNGKSLTSDDIAKIQAKILLLNDKSYKSFLSNQYFWINSIITNCGNMKLEKSIFPDLWTKLNKQQEKFLRIARLSAVYHLKITNVVEHILELKLGPIENNRLSVKFRGQRKKIDTNQKPKIIEFKGDCYLK